MITARDITRGKPDPEPYLKGAALLGFAPNDCLVIEDAAAGIRAGKAAGARVIAVQTTETSTLLPQLGADWIIKDCSALSINETPLKMGADGDDLIINVAQSPLEESGK